MNARKYISGLVVFVSGLLLISCLLPGMIPLGRGTPVPTPVMEKDASKVIQALNAKNYVTLESLAQEKYTQQDYGKPGTLTFTVKITDNKPTYFSYGWCAVDDKTLQQNFQHIKVSLYFNDKQLGQDVVHSLSYTSPDNMACGDLGVLLSDWPAGQYKLKAVATFADRINDGVSDYAAGDYVFVYNVTVAK